MRRLAVVTAIVVGSMIVWSGITSGASGKGRTKFGDDSITGSWGFAGRGIFLAADFAEIGVLRFDGQGGCSLTDHVANVEGLNPHDHYSVECTYSVNRAGVGSAHIVTNQLTESLTIAFVLVAGGQEMRLIYAGTDGAQGEGEAVRQ